MLAGGYGGPKEGELLVLEDLAVLGLCRATLWVEEEAEVEGESEGYEGHHEEEEGD